MSDRMQTLELGDVLNWMLREYRQDQSIWNLPRQKFFRPSRDKSVKIFGRSCEIPLGPAAGPHTQLAQNIVTAYLAGARFFELKTVQILDQLAIDKPCIDASDEGYNTEWSTELTVRQAFAEYVKAWFIIHFLHELLHLSGNTLPGIVFNMSVGYDLNGIKSEKINSFIESLKRAGQNEFFLRCRQILKNFIEENEDLGVDPLLAERIPDEISNSITLSTMHGCPPQDQEAICRYLLGEKKLHTYVKLNPTLLGYDFVYNTLNTLGYRDIKLKEESFSHDLQYPDAIDMLHRLQDFANRQGLEFGVKLSNTLPVINSRQILPGEEMYMSGRSLFPLTLNLAARLSDEFQGNLAISFSGGTNYFNLESLLKCGIMPVTMATELLKPGGYARLNQLAGQYLHLRMGQPGKIPTSLLQDYANQSISDQANQKEARFSFHLKTDLPLPEFDCFLAPCVAACPIHQDVPQYIRLLEEERYEEALSLIFQRNPLPHITGSICDHQCLYKCVRNDYECPVQIRDLKYLAARKGQNELLSQLDQMPETENARVAVVGAGPAGLAAASFLARNGFRVKVFEKKSEAGGMVRYVIPSFRLEQEALDQDLALLSVLGVEFEFNCSPGLTVEKLREQGYEYIILAIGAWHSRPLQIECSDGRMVNAIEFLQEFNRAPSRLKPGKQVVVVGGGNSAMDGARAARLLPGVEKVSIVYRRTVQEMPADREEYLAALADGVNFLELLLPVSFQEGIVTCQKMILGEPDTSGRKQPVPLPEFQDLPADLLLTAIGEKTDYQFLENLGIRKTSRDNFHIDPDSYETNLPGVFLAGDALHGPASVVQAIADAWQVAETIMQRENIKLTTDFAVDYPINPQAYRQDIIHRKALLKQCIHEQKLIDPEEAKRCLGCDLICNKCVEVCPNRANIAICVKGDFLKDYTQILHLDGLCNECGNCETFCPYQGAPYKDKITLFWLAEDFRDSSNNGFYFEEIAQDIIVNLRWQNQLFHLNFSLDGTLKNPDLSFRDQDKIVRFIWTIFEDYNYLLVKGNRQDV